MNPPKMPFHIGDYKRDTGHLRAAGHGAYLLLLFHQWSTGSLPTDDDQLSAIACMTRGEWKKMRPVIEPFFKPGWKHGRVERDLKDAKASYEKRAKAGELGGKAKAEAKQSSSNATAKPKLPLTLDQERKKDAADAALPGFEEATPPAPDNLEKQLFERGKAILGTGSGGLIAKLLKAKKGDVALARAAVELASTKQNPREFIGAVVAGGNASVDGRRLTNDEQYWGVGRTPGII